MVCGLALSPTCPLQTEFSHHPVICRTRQTNMISSVRRCTLGGIISGLNGDASIALVRESANFDRRKGQRGSDQVPCGPAAGDGRARSVWSLWWWLDSKPQSQKHWWYT